MKLLKEHIIRWKKEEFGSIETRKQNCLSKIESLEIKGMEGGLSQEEGRAKAEAVHDYETILRMEETSWRQRLRVAWLKEGDRNSKFFHNITNWKHSTNLITKLLVDGKWVNDQEQIHDEIEKYYTSLHKDPIPCRPVLEGVDFERIDEEQRSQLERPFADDKVKAALSSLKDDKAPSPNGFPSKFLKVCWDVVGKEVMAVFEALHTRDQW